MGIFSVYDLSHCPWSYANLFDLIVRCGLTFMAIQEPGLSKFCSLCGAEYLSEDMLDEGSDFADECRKLATVFDTCVYCQGKFLA